MFNCLNCNLNYINNIELQIHKEICIFYLYNSRYSKKINNEVITNIVDISNLFKLHKTNQNSISYKNDMLLNLKNEFLIMNSILSFNKNNYIKEKQIIVYLYNYIKKSNKEIYNYLEIIDIISNIYKISHDDIINIINIYKICYYNYQF
jgi:hypothetical protein